MVGFRRLVRLWSRSQEASPPAAPPERPSTVHADIAAKRGRKMERLRPFLKLERPHRLRGGAFDFLTPELRRQARIADTPNVSANGYDETMQALIRKHADGLILDCGAGCRPDYRENVVNFEIVDYPSTDVIGVGEELPFVDDCFDAVFSIAVLEHVRDPFRCAEEIARVLKPGGDLYCAIAFMQPVHGYPHHYFNATPQGARALFEDHLTVKRVEVLPSTHPVWTLSWYLNRWREGLAPALRTEFDGLRLGDLLQPGGHYLDQPFCRDLAAETQLDLASAVVLTATKDPAGPTRVQP